MTKREPFARVEAHTVGGLIAFFNLLAEGTIIDTYQHKEEKRAKQARDSLNLRHEARVKEAVREAVEAFKKKLVSEIRDKVPRAHTYGSENADVYWAYDAGRDAALKVLESLPTEPEGK